MCALVQLMKHYYLPLVAGLGDDSRKELSVVLQCQVGHHRGFTSIFAGWSGKVYFDTRISWTSCLFFRMKKGSLLAQLTWTLLVSVSWILFSYLQLPWLTNLLLVIELLEKNC